MSKKYQLELLFLRYVPTVARDTSVAIGAILVNGGGELVGFRFANDLRSARCLMPDTDMDALEMLGAHLERELVAVSSMKEFRRVFENYVTSGVELTASRGVETDDPVQELNAISHLYLDTPLKKGASQLSGRAAIKKTMDSRFEEKGVLKLLQRNTHVAAYTKADDQFTIDYLYQFGQMVKMFQAVSMASAENQGASLAIRHDAIKDGLKREGRELRLTAVVEDIAGPEAGYPYAMYAMEKAQILVVPVAEMTHIAEVARLELRA